MKLSPPERGSVIRYAYLWASEHRRGKDEARKDRPALVLALSVIEESGSISVLVLAITHAQPAREDDGIRLPDAVKRQLGLDEAAPSWIVTTEANAFVWPGPDLRPIPRRKPAKVIYGKIPAALLRRVAQSYLANRERQRATLVRRLP